MLENVITQSFCLHPCHLCAFASLRSVHCFAIRRGEQIPFYIYGVSCEGAVRSGADRVIRKRPADPLTFPSVSVETTALV
jgi:hypothetical protein